MAMATMQGVTKWFKALGEPRENKFKGGAREWSFQLGVGSAEKLFLRQNKVKKKVNFDEEIGDYITITLDEFNKKTKNKNEPITVVDNTGQPWPADKWVGNGSTIKVDVIVDKYKFVKEGDTIEGARLIPTKIVIVEHQEYKSQGKTETKKVDTVNWKEE